MSLRFVEAADVVAPPRPAYAVGLDLGQAQDYSALAVVEHAGRSRDRPLLVRHLHRWPLGTAYPAIVADVAATLAAPPLPAGAVLAIDRTGVGRAVFDLFAAAAIRPPSAGWVGDPGDPGPL